MGAGAGGEAHATTASATAAIFIHQSFANARVPSIVGRVVRAPGWHLVARRELVLTKWRDGMREVTIASIAELNAFTSRRSFVRLMGVGGALVLLPALLTACEDSGNTGGISGPGTGSTVTIDFARGDIAVLQFAYILEQLEADFYTQVVANFLGSTLTTAEQAILVDIRNHEVIHREFLKATLGADGDFTLAPILGTNFKDRVAVLAAAKAFEDLGVAAYNGAAQYLTDVNHLLAAGKIVSVEARHASAIRDLISPLSGDFAPTSFDNAFTPAKVAFAAQPFITEQLDFANAPAAFTQGPNTNG